MELGPLERSILLPAAGRDQFFVISGSGRWRRRGATYGVIFTTTRSQQLAEGAPCYDGHCAISAINSALRTALYVNLMPTWVAAANIRYNKETKAKKASKS